MDVSSADSVPSAVSVSPNDVDPLVLAMEEHVLPIAKQLGLTREQLIPLLVAAGKCPSKKREGVWRFPSTDQLEKHLLKLKGRAKKLRKLLTIIGIDLRNVGGLNEIFGETKVNEFIDALLDLIICAAKDLCAAHDESEFQLIHYGGGDEYLLVVLGVDEFRPIIISDKSGTTKSVPCHDVTRAMDTLVRMSVQYSIDRGLDMVPHPKRWWRIQWWGTGVFYGISYYDPRDPTRPDLTPQEMLSQAAILVQKCKRGLRIGANGRLEHDPLELGLWQQIRRMWKMPRVILYKLFNVGLGIKLKDAPLPEWKTAA